jgi:hypothetical protein
MVSRQFSRLSLRCRVMLIVFAVITVQAELIVRSTWAREYYHLRVQSLQGMALMAVKMGAQYLPADPHAAVRLANSYVQSQGIAPAEIVFTKLSSDNKVLSIKLDYKIPTFVAVLAMGRLPARNVEVTASAWRQDAQFPSRARNALSFPFSNEPQKRVVTSANWLVQRRHRGQDFTRRPGSRHTPQEMLLEAEQAGPATRQIFSGKSSVLLPGRA